MCEYFNLDTAFSDRPSFVRSELKKYIKHQNPTLKNSSLDWAIYNMCQKRIVQRVAHNKYKLFTAEKTLPEYKPDLSEHTSEIMKFMKKRFHLLSFIVWETRAYNEFMNHQMERNYIFVEVEKPFGESVFAALNEQYYYKVLYKPDEKEIALYSGDITVSVLPLTSEAPVCDNTVRIEKLLADLFATRLLIHIISKGEYPGIFEEAYSMYQVNKNQLFRYAKRRGKYEEVYDFIKENTNIPLT